MLRSLALWLSLTLLLACATVEAQTTTTTTTDPGTTAAVTTTGAPATTTVAATTTTAAPVTTAAPMTTGAGWHHTCTEPDHDGCIHNDFRGDVVCDRNRIVRQHQHRDPNHDHCTDHTHAERDHAGAHSANESDRTTFEHERHC
jgi:hypothetical protein